jgi:isopenicillin N synthase-like dioxygenase
MVQADGERALPVIDIGAFLCPPKLPEGIVDVEAAKAETAAKLRDACTDWGFFYVKNHGVEKSLVEGVHDMARRYACPVPSKHALGRAQGSRSPLANFFLFHIPFLLGAIHRHHHSSPPSPHTLF